MPATGQLLLDETLDASWCHRVGSLLFHVLTQPCRGPIKMTQLKPVDTQDIVIRDPGGTVAIRSNNEKLV
jgi:hypothetical protein